MAFFLRGDSSTKLFGQNMAFFLRGGTSAMYLVKPAACTSLCAGFRVKM